jgi:chemotaxis protein CheD
MTLARFNAARGEGGRKVLIVQGEHAVSSDPEVAISTILGSCVAVCLYDANRGVGGMNHFLLAETADGVRMEEEAMRYGAYAMEVLINDLMKRGASRDHLEAKLFGGAKMFDSLNDVGASNAAFARRFMADEGIPVVAESLGGRSARRVEFWPTTGRVRQKAVDQAPPAPVRPAPAPPQTDDVELF